MIMDNGKNAITILFTIDDHPDRLNVVNLVILLLLALHLAVNAIQMFGATTNIKVFHFHRHHAIAQYHRNFYQLLLTTLASFRH